MKVKKIITGVLAAAFFWVGTLSAQKKINVYDTLVKQEQLHQLHGELTYMDPATTRKRFFLAEDGTLKRTVYLNEDVYQYHKEAEDSLNNFLLRAFPGVFKGLSFFAGENINWKLESGSVFQWKKGKKISTAQLNKVFATEFEANHIYKRPSFLQDEEDAHCFSFQNYLHDSISKTIYGFNELSGLYAGKIIYDAQNNIVSEIAYYLNRQIAMELKNGIFSVYSYEGKKLFDHTEEEISAYSDNGSIAWKYNTKTKKISGNENKQVGWNPEIDYVTKLKSVWKEINKG